VETSLHDVFMIICTFIREKEQEAGVGAVIEDG
jgi:hypothetical protein